jgi:hypothetical protein
MSDFNQKPKAISKQEAKRKLREVSLLNMLIKTSILGQ